MRAAIVLAGCFLIFSAFAAEQQQSPASGAQAKPVVIAQAATQTRAGQPAKSEAPARVWTLEMSCCEPQ
jgi:hypothetical protein